MGCIEYQPNPSQFFLLWYYCLSKTVCPGLPRTEEDKQLWYGRQAHCERKHEPIISEEIYFKVQNILDGKCSTKRAKARRGQKPCLDVYCREMRCDCGSSYNRKVWHRTKENQVQYAYQCYNQINTGTVATRLKKGLSTEGICETPMIPGWKIRIMADWIFRTLWVDKKHVLKLANEMLEKNLHEEKKEATERVDLDYLKREME